MTTEEWQLLISGFTLLLTPIASAVVVSVQLRKSHSWWLKQQQYLWEKENIQRKYDLYERAARVLGRLNTLLLDQQVFLFSRNKCEYMLRHCIRPELVKTEFVNSEWKRYCELVVTQNEKIRDSKAEFQQIALLGRVYFGSEIEQSAMLLAMSLKQAEKQVVPLAEVVQLCNSLLQDGKSLDEAISSLDPLFDQRWDERNSKDHIGAFLETIYRHLSSINNAQQVGQLERS